MKTRHLNRDLDAKEVSKLLLMQAMVHSVNVSADHLTLAHPLYGHVPYLGLDILTCTQYLNHLLGKQAAHRIKVNTENSVAVTCPL